MRETGFWRPRGEGDEVELLVAGADGVLEIYVGAARTTTSWELATDVVARTPRRSTGPLGCTASSRAR